MLIAVLSGLLMFVLLFLVAARLEQQKTGMVLRLERLRTIKKGNHFSVGGILGLDTSIAALGSKLALAGNVSDPEEILLWFALAIVTLGALAIYYGYLLLAMLLPVVTVAIGRYLLDAMASRRLRILEVQFKDFMMSLSLHLKVTQAFQPAFIRAAEKAERPLRDYLDRVVAGLQSGESIEATLEGIKQIPSTHIASWVDCASFAVRIKSDLSRMCTRTAARLSLKTKMANKINAQTAQSKSLMVSMGGIMLFMAVSTMTSSPEFVEFYTSPLGRTAATMAILSFVVATLYVLRKIDREMSK